MIPSWSADASIGIVVDGGTASGVDFELPVSRIPVPAGHSVVDFSIPLIDDTEVEPNETFPFQLVDPDRLRRDRTVCRRGHHFRRRFGASDHPPYEGIYFSGGEVLGMDSFGVDVAPRAPRRGLRFCSTTDRNPWRSSIWRAGATDTFTTSGEQIPPVPVRFWSLPGKIARRGRASRPRFPVHTPTRILVAPAPALRCPKRSSHPSAFEWVRVSGTGHVAMGRGPNPRSRTQRRWRGNLGRSRRPETENYAVDSDVEEGATYHYRGRSWVTQEWIYLGSESAGARGPRGDPGVVGPAGLAPTRRRDVALPRCRCAPILPRHAPHAAAKRAGHRVARGRHHSRVPQRRDLSSWQMAPGRRSTLSSTSVTAGCSLSAATISLPA